MAKCSQKAYIERMFVAMNRANPDGSNTKTIIVMKASNGWILCKANQPAEAFQTKANAVSAARDKLDRSGGVLIVHNARGGMEQMTIVGSAAARRLNAIEGLTLDLSSRNLVRDLKAKDLTPAKRRAEVVRRFKQVAAG